MKRATLLVLFCSAMASWGLAQQPSPTPVPAAPSPPPETVAPGPAETPPPDQPVAPGLVETKPPDQPAAPDTLGNAPTAVAEAPGARELPLDSEAFDVRVHRRVAEYGQRHEQRESRMSSYDQVSGGDPGLARFADPRKVQVELSDELDREQTSAELAADYAEEAHDIQNKAQALEEFIAKRKQTLDALSKPAGPSNRQDLEVALANLAHQPSSPETLAAMREIDRRLSETDRNDKDLPAQLSQNQQETADAAEELAKLQAMQQAYEKESKAFTADALSARQNRLRLANKLEYFVVRAQAEDTLEQGRKALSTVEHLAPSPQVESLLAGPASATKSDAHLEQMRDCINKSGDVQGCRQASHGE
ncbi:MAG TPA: hypothetical protein VEN79_08870 [Terriglobia bacterium]|nr:hypothetical protein [Terriglobia bacterium]